MNLAQLLDTDIMVDFGTRSRPHICERSQLSIYSDLDIFGVSPKEPSAKDQ